MKGLMMDCPLLLKTLLWRAEHVFSEKEIITWMQQGIHRYTYGDYVGRVRRLANALTALGIRQGDRVGTLAWNTYRHFEAYFAIPCMGAVLHTINLRLFPEQIAWIINHAADRVLTLRRLVAHPVGAASSQPPPVILVGSVFTIFQKGYHSCFITPTSPAHKYPVPG